MYAAARQQQGGEKGARPQHLHKLLRGKFSVPGEHVEQEH
jgi:hypothetical protein